jgi:hypothetical protein
MRPFGTPLTASPFMPTSTLSRPRPIGDVNTGLQLLFQSRMRGKFPATPISVGSRSINGFQGVWVTDAYCSHRHTTENPHPENWISIGSQPTDGFSRETDHIIEFTTPSKPSESPLALKSDCIGCLATILVRGKRTPDSRSPH